MNAPGQLATARRLRDADLSLLPIGTDKVPCMALLPVGGEGKATWTPCQTQLADDATLDHWFGNRRAADIAIIAGLVSGQVCTLDFDELRFYETWCQRVGALAEGLVRQRTRPGMLVIFRCPSSGNNQISGRRHHLPPAQPRRLHRFRSADRRAVMSEATAGRWVGRVRFTVRAGPNVGATARCSDR